MTDRFFNSTFFVILSFKSYLFKKLLKPILFISSATALLCFLYEMGWLPITDALALPSLMGAALGILLVFRNNTAYERWWEARKALGSLVNISRSFAMQAAVLLPANDDRKGMLGLIVAFCYALKEHLRGGVKLSEIAFLRHAWHEEVKQAQHRPNAIATIMNRTIRQQRLDGHLGEYEALKLMEEAEKLVDVLGRCERIRNTPMPTSHGYLLKFYMFIYTITLPVGFIATLHWWSIVAVASIYFVMMSIVAIAEEIEDPFGHDPNDLPVDAIVKNIHRNINEIYVGIAGLPAGDEPISPTTTTDIVPVA